MVNHFFTVLANIPGEYIPSTSEFYDLYTPPHSSREPTKAMVPIDHVLFSDCSCNDDRRQKAFQLMYLVHGSDLSYALTEKDTRTTYQWPDRLVPNRYKGSLLHSINELDVLPASCLAQILTDDDTKKYFYDAGTFVDKLAALTVAYVRKLDVS